jgi:hypothetical protein
LDQNRRRVLRLRRCRRIGSPAAAQEHCRENEAADQKFDVDIHYGEVSYRDLYFPA